MTTDTATHDDAMIRHLIDTQQRGICAKNVDHIVADYADDVVLFDAIPPFQTQGAAAVRRAWEGCLPYFPESFGIETRDLQISVGTDMAYAHWLFRFTGAEDHPGMQNFLRVSAVYRKLGGAWKIVHEHVSVPFDPATSQAVLTSKPEDVPPAC